MSESILEVFKADGWRLGDCAIIPYDRKRVDIWGTNYLHYLYGKCLESRPSSPWGVLPDLMCGFADLSSDAVCSYLAGKPIAILCVHTSPTEFTPAGFCWPTEQIRSPAANSAFCAFVVFRPFWGTPESTVLGMLGISYLFTTYGLRTIMGQRVSSNVLAGKWMEKYGATDVGVVPDLLRTHKGGLESCTLSVLHRADFENYCRHEILKLARGGIQDGQKEDNRSPRSSPIQ